MLKISIIDELPQAVEKAIGKLSRLKKELEIQEHTKAEEPESLLDQIEQYLEENFRKKITLDDIADTLHVNRSYLSRYYKNKTGVNLFDEILMKRVEKAKEYLQNTEMKTYEISEAVGVEDAGYFSKMFKKITGVSPKEFRKREQNEEKNKSPFLSHRNSWKPAPWRLRKRRKRACNHHDDSCMGWNR